MLTLSSTCTYAYYFINKSSLFFAFNLIYLAMLYRDVNTKFIFNFQNYYRIFQFYLFLLQLLMIIFLKQI
jgi:hypothetical protein